MATLVNRWGSVERGGVAIQCRVIAQDVENSELFVVSVEGVRFFCMAAQWTQNQEWNKPISAERIMENVQ